MSVDRTEKMVINRSHTGTFVKVTLIESGVTVNYTVKTYESRVPQAIDEAFGRAEKLLLEATKTRA